MRYDREITSCILKLVIPIILSSLVSNVAGFLSILFVARQDASMLSSFTLIYSVMSVLTMFIYGFIIPTTLLVSKKFGEGKTCQIRFIFHDSVLVTLLVGTIPFIILLNSYRLLIWFGQPQSVAFQASLYFNAMLFGYLPMLLSWISSQLFIGLNKPTINLFFVFINSILNFVLIVLMSPLLYIKGIGYAAAITNWIVFILQIIYISVYPKMKSLHLFHWSFQLDYIKSLFKMGLSIVIQRMTELLALSMMTFFMGWLGIAVLSAQQVVSQITMLLLVIPFSFMQAAGMLVGKAHGQQNILLIRQYVYHLNALSLIILLLLAFMCWLASDTLIHLFLTRTQINVQQLTVNLLRLGILTLFFDNVRNILTGVLRGMSDFTWSMLYSLISLWLIAIPLGYLFAFYCHLGALGVALGWLSGIAVGTFFVLGRVALFMRQ